MADTSGQITETLIREVKRRIRNECLQRVTYCLDQLTDDQIWWRPNDQSNSIGNLVLHLCGNMRQWILSGLGGQPDTRERQLEFDQRGPVGKAELLRRLHQVVDEIIPVIERVQPDDLTTVYDVQIYRESGLAILVHVTEHFSYHTGQIAWITKMLTAEDLGFYAGEELG
ncbi:MAG: DinB family protein [Saprospiraceae bacterium]|nr:DinB family protein [Saprospiraceae bacterium]